MGLHSGDFHTYIWMMMIQQNGRGVKTFAQRGNKLAFQGAGPGILMDHLVNVVITPTFIDFFARDTICGQAGCFITLDSPQQ